MNSLHLHSVPSLAAALILSGCATPPVVIDSAHPANADAPEASAKPIPNTLRADAATRRTQSLLAERERESSAAESETPADQTDLHPKVPPPAPPSPTSNAPAEFHEHHD